MTKVEILHARTFQSLNTKLSEFQGRTGIDVEVVDFLKLKDAQDEVAVLIHYHCKPQKRPLPEVKNHDALPHCPQCGIQMVLRQNRENGDQFFGCPAFPDCKGKRPMTPELNTAIFTEKPVVDHSKDESIPF